jgi:signal transduction histidine kinase/CheY-like chemotaxis protein
MSMTGPVKSSPAEQISIDAPARRVRRMARVQAAVIGVVSMLLAIGGLVIPMIPPGGERLPAYGVLIALMLLGGLALGVFDFAVGRNLVRLVESASEFRRAAADRASELAQLNSELRQRYRWRSELFATMSHELRTPLNAILGFSRALLDGVDGDLNSAQRDDALQIHDGGRGLLGVVNSVLELARLEAGAVTVTEEIVSVGPLVHEVLSLLRPLADARRLALSAELDPGLPPVLADEDRLRQCLVNLVGNAIKFTEHGCVTVRASRGERMVSIDVVDTGVGIAPDAQELIFQPFRQAEAADTRRHGGTGLGLAIVRQTATLMQGRVWVESELGVGSTFHLAVPVAPAEAHAPLLGMSPMEGVDVLVLSNREEAELLVSALGNGSCTAVLASGDSWRQIHTHREASLAVIDLLQPRAGAWCMLADLGADAVGARLRPGLFAMADGVGRTVVPRSLDMLAEPALDSQFGRRLDVLLRERDDALDMPNGPVVVASADPAWRGRVAALLARQRQTVIEVGTVASTLATVRDRQASALVLDILLPSPGVISLLADLGGDVALRSVPVLLIAPASLTPSQQHQLRLGTLAWLDHDRQPVEELAVQLRGALNRTRGRLVRAGGR